MNTFIKYYVYAVIAIVLAAIIAAFFLVGSPQKNRLLAIDTRRVSDLQTIQDYIVNYWQGKNVLPANLEVLNDELRGISVPNDPETGDAYGYEILGSNTFQVCATFALPSEGTATPARAAYPQIDPKRGALEGSSWEHPAGAHCFERTIDPDFYKNYYGTDVTPF